MSRGVGQPSNPHVTSHTSVKYTVRIHIANKPSRIPRRRDTNAPRRPCGRLAFISENSWEKCIVQPSFRSFSPPPLPPLPPQLLHAITGERSRPLPRTVISP